MWKYLGQNTSGVTGVPARDLTDEEFNLYSGKIGAQFPGQPKALVNSGVWEHIDDVPSKTKPTKDATTTKVNVQPINADDWKEEEKLDDGNGSTVNSGS